MRTVFIALVLAQICGAAFAASGDSQLIARAKQSVIKDYKDPDSAKFRNIKVVSGSVCGEVNAKNSFGGYVGYKRFVSVAGVVAWVEGESENFSESASLCSATPPKNYKP
ncbi:hypothetical protein [Massilia timonae]|uniref:hypothetical protein n=1 Tax=Massilia timonae TaxID=47229 RepID=UPI00289996FF|nr:hypothetical protein [Massilia timonae]